MVFLISILSSLTNWGSRAPRLLRGFSLDFVSSGGTYFQDYLPHFAQAALRAGWTDFVGLGRMMLAYPEFPGDVLEKGRLERNKIWRTFSDCINAPRHGLVSGYYPLDSFYKGRTEAKQLQAKKAELRKPSPNPLLR